MRLHQGEGRLRTRFESPEQGVALLAVLWLSVALTMIAMTTAYLVRTEASAVADHIDSERAEFLARGAVEAAVYAINRAGAAPLPDAEEPSPLQPFQRGQRWLRFQFQQGASLVEVVPENAKLNVNSAPPDQLAALLVLLGEPEAESRELAAAIADWRSPRRSTVSTPFDIFYAGLPQPYTARHATIEKLEELLAVKGMSRDLFFGRLRQTAAGAWKRTPPLADLVTTERSFGGVNINYAAYEVLRVLPGWDESLAAAVIEARSRPGSGNLLESVPGLSEAASLYPVTLSPGLAYTLTATAQIRDSAVRHTVRAQIRMDRSAPMGFRVVGWREDWPWSAEAPAGIGGEMETIGGSRL